MEFVPTETLMCLASCLMPSLTRGHSRARRNRRFRSFFGTSVETCADLWYLCHNALHPDAWPMHLLWTLVFLKQHNTEEVNASLAGVHEDTFRDWVWHVLNVIDSINYVSTRVFLTSVINFFLDKFR